MVGELGLRTLTVVVDDPDLGRQAFRAGHGPFEAGSLSGPPGCRADPPLPEARVDAELLRDLCVASLRLEMLRDPDAASGPEAAELALRRLPGVHAVVVEHEGDLTLVQVHADDGAGDDLGRQAARAMASVVDAGLVVEVVRERPEPSATSEPPAPSAPHEPLSEAGDDAPAIVAVRSDVEAGEIEVHVRAGDVRTIGRAPVAQGLAGAVNAALDAVRSIDGAVGLGLGWARTIETTAERRFVVAVGLIDPTTRASRHGLGEGDNPIEAAAHATLDAIARDPAPA